FERDVQHKREFESTAGDRSGLRHSSRHHDRGAAGHQRNLRHQYQIHKTLQVERLQADYAPVLDCKSATHRITSERRSDRCTSGAKALVFFRSLMSELKLWLFEKPFMRQGSFYSGRTIRDSGENWMCQGCGCSRMRSHFSLKSSACR